jgi:cation diffusion facilitator CzcD-associated flavoprotein CzcO
VVEDYGVKPNLRLSHEVLAARWLSEESAWEIKVKDLSSGNITIDTADFFVSAPGRVNQPYYPDLQGLEDFQGTVLHTARWDPQVDLRNKHVAVIGNGASGQQILPNILPEVAHIDHYVRSKTYVSPTFRQGLLEASQEIPGGHIYSEEGKRSFRDDPKAYLAYRKDLDKTHYGGVNNRFATIGSEANQKLRQSLLSTMLARLKGDEEWLARLTPDYAPGCKRLTPAPGYLEAIIGPKVEFVDAKITRATTSGLETEDGNVRNVDVIILATGFRDGFYPRFPTIDEKGQDLSQAWRPGGKIGYPETYLGIMAPQAPNYFFVLQAQGNAFGGTVPYQCEISATYIAGVIRKVQRHGYKSIRPSPRAAEEFGVVVDRYFENSVINDGCRTYFKLGGKTGKARNVIGFPGTTRQRLEVLSEPRWEDFLFDDTTTQSDQGSVRDGTGTTVTDLTKNNRFLTFWGDGRSALDMANDLDAMTDYLTEVGKVDLRRLHEGRV